MNDIVMALSLHGAYSVVSGVLDYSARPLRWEWVWLHFTVGMLSFGKHIMSSEHFD